MSMLSLARKEICTGCSACAEKCAVGAMSMRSDEYGFLYPYIDKAKCTSCGACAKACPLLKDIAPANVWPKCFIAKSKDIDSLMQSSSGGMFTEFARKVMAMGGVVFGCVMHGGRAIHVKAEDMSGVSQMQGSKYVQSEMGECFKDCKKELDRGRQVLFSGTPCQIAGLLSYLGKDYSNLLTVGLICHGVASPKSLSNYIEEEGHQRKTKVISIEFRNKIANPGESSVVVNFQGGSAKIESTWRNVYMRAFLLALSYRNSCFACRFRSGRSGADIVIGDFWGIEKVSPEFPSKNGVSAVLIYTDKGMSAFADVDIIKEPCGYSDVAKDNYNLDHNSHKKRMLRWCFLRVVKRRSSMYTFFRRYDKFDFLLRVIRSISNKLIKI